MEFVSFSFNDFYTLEFGLLLYPFYFIVHFDFTTGGGVHSFFTTASFGP